MKEIKVVPQLCFTKGSVDLVSEHNSYTPTGTLIEKGIVLRRIKRACLDKMDRPLRVLPSYDKYGAMIFRPVLRSER